MRRALLQVYLAAGLSFGAGVLRDVLLVREVPAHADVFGVMYASALAAGFGVNAITLGQVQQRPGRFGFVWLLLASTLLYAGLMAWQKPAQAANAWLGLPVPGLYLLGARHARRLMDAGVVFIGRIRDGVASLLMALLLWLGLKAESLPLAVLASTLLTAWAAWRLGVTGAGDAAGGPALAPGADPRRRWMAALLYGNLASVLMNFWALQANAQTADTVLGWPAPVAVRGAMYLFQLLSLPSVLATRVDWSRHLALGRVRAGTWGCAALAALAATLPLAHAVWTVPLLALATLYGAVVTMRLVAQAEAA